jgi:hypothetical protein
MRAMKYTVDLAAANKALPFAAHLGLEIRDRQLTPWDIT